METDQQISSIFSIRSANNQAIKSFKTDISIFFSLGKVSRISRTYQVTCGQPHFYRGVRFCDISDGVWMHRKKHGGGPCTKGLARERHWWEHMIGAKLCLDQVTSVL